MPAASPLDVNILAKADVYCVCRPWPTAIQPENVWYVEAAYRISAVNQDLVHMLYHPDRKSVV